MVISSKCFKRWCEYVLSLACLKIALGVCSVIVCDGGVGLCMPGRGFVVRCFVAFGVGLYVLLVCFLRAAIRVLACGCASGW